MKFKVPVGIKSTFVFTCLLFVEGVLTNSDVMMLASAVIFVVLSVAIEILEAIFKIGKG